MYKELSEKGTFHSGLIVPLAEISQAPADYVRYCSMYSFDESILDHVKIHKSVTGFRGNVFAQVLWIDIDVHGDLEKARQLALKFVVKLNRDYQLSPSDLFIYFSGGKGFHIAIHGKSFEEFKPSKDLPALQKKLASTLAGDVEIDTTIYETVRIFRMTNSKHDSGYYKVEISYEELCSSIENILAIATKPRIFKREKSLNQIFKNDGLCRVWRDTKITEVEKNDVQQDAGFWKPVKKGKRNPQLFRQAAMLFDKSELSKQAVYDVMFSINQQCEPPLENSELNTLVNSAFEKTSKNKKKSDLVIKPFAGWVDEYLEYVFHPSSKMTTGFPSFDRVLRHKLKGQLCCKVGYGGSKKSLSTLNAAMRNIQDHDCHVIYSTMEMSAKKLNERIVDYIVDGEHTNASYEIENMTRAEAERLLKDRLAPILGNKLYISENGSLTCDDYENLINRTIEETGKVDMLVVDGLSMMGGADTEVQRFSDNTKQLKELANKFNIYVEVICHVSKGADWHTRDLTDKVRGSEKIFDNCDFMITFSQIIDTMAISESTEYIKDKGYVRFYDKRGTGITLNKIYHFNTHKLRLEETDENPSEYEFKGKRKNEYSM